MSILKVEVGAPVTMKVKDVRDVTGKFGPQLAFDAENGDTLFVGRDTGLRQLERIGVTEAAGMTLLFEKVEKNGKTYLNINPASQAAKNGKSGGGSAQAKSGAGGGNSAGTERVSRPLGAVYADCLSLAATTVRQVLGKDAPVDAIMSATACLFIEANKSGKALRPVPDQPKKPVPSDDFEEFADGLIDEDDSNLPF